MILGIGIDIIERARIEELSFQNRVADFILTDTEKREYEAAGDTTAHLGSRFAVKEAVIKAHPEVTHYHQIEVKRAPDGGVEVHVLDETLEDGRIYVSLTHSETVCGAVAVVTRNT